MNEQDKQTVEIDNSRYTNTWWSPGRSPVVIALWRSIGMHLFRWTPNEPYFAALWNGYKCWLLRLFGAKVGCGVVIRSSCEIYYPWNLEIGDHAWIGYGSNLYSLVKIRIGKSATVSQNAYLCTGSHDTRDPYMGLIVGDIVVEDGAWVSANVFVNPGVTIGKGAVVTPGSVVSSDMPAGMICRGNPCRPVVPRKVRDVPPGVGGGVKRGGRLIPPGEQ